MPPAPAIARTFARSSEPREEGRPVCGGGNLTSHPKTCRGIPGVAPVWPGTRGPLHAEGAASSQAPTASLRGVVAPMLTPQPLPEERGILRVDLIDAPLSDVPAADQPHQGAGTLRGHDDLVDRYEV